MKPFLRCCELLGDANAGQGDEKKGWHSDQGGKSLVELEKAQGQGAYANLQIEAELLLESEMHPHAFNVDPSSCQHITSPRLRHGSRAESQYGARRCGTAPGPRGMQLVS